eukprot:4882128-Amphidinium_carterae.1
MSLTLENAWAWLPLPRLRQPMLRASIVTVVKALEECNPTAKVSYGLARLAAWLTPYKGRHWELEERDRRIGRSKLSLKAKFRLKTSKAIRNLRKPTLGAGRVEVACSEVWPRVWLPVPEPIPAPPPEIPVEVLHKPPFEVGAHKRVAEFTARGRSAAPSRRKNV